MADIPASVDRASCYSSPLQDADFMTLVQYYQTEYPFLNDLFKIQSNTPYLRAFPCDRRESGPTSDFDRATSEAWRTFHLALTLCERSPYAIGTALLSVRAMLDEHREIVQRDEAAQKIWAEAQTDKYEEISCIICCDSMDRRIFFRRTLVAQSCSSCAQPVCDTCLRTMFLAGLTDSTRMPAKCCNVFPVYMAFGSKYWSLNKAVLSAEEAQAYREKYEEFRTIKRSYCPVPTCSAFIPTRLIEQAKQAQSKIDSPMESSPVGVACPRCSTQACVSCHQVAHTGACSLVVDDALENALKEWGYKRCPKCSHGVRRMFGCDHMQCICGASWCWQCTKPWYECMGDCRYGGATQDRTNERVDNSDEANRRRHERWERRHRRGPVEDPIEETLFLRDPVAWAEILLADQDWELDNLMEDSLALRDDPQQLKELRDQEAEQLFLLTMEDTTFLRDFEQFIHAELLEKSRAAQVAEYERTLALLEDTYALRDFDVQAEKMRAELEAVVQTEAYLEDSLFFRDQSVLDSLYRAAEMERYQALLDTVPLFHSVEGSDDSPFAADPFEEDTAPMEPEVSAEETQPTEPVPERSATPTPEPHPDLPVHDIHGTNFDGHDEYHWRRDEYNFGADPLPERQDRSWYCAHTYTHTFLPLCPLVSGAGYEECFLCWKPLFESEEERDRVMLDKVEQNWLASYRSGIASKRKRRRADAADVEIAHGDWDAWESIFQELEDEKIGENALRRESERDATEACRPRECLECRMVWCRECWGKEKGKDGAGVEGQTA